MGNRAGDCLIEAGAYGVGFLLSCGPSQVFGVVKGVIDVIRLAIIQNKITNVTEEINRIQGINLNERDVTVILSKDEQNLLATKRRKLIKYENRFENKVRDLKGDALALIPLVGAILSWRVYEETFFSGSYSSTGFEHAIPQMMGDHSKDFAAAFYPKTGTGKVGDDGLPIRKGDTQIPVIDDNGKRMLDAYFWQHDEANPRPTVVIFHGNGMTSSSMGDWGNYYYGLGYDVLMPTMGGYPGSDSVKTCEESTYYDVEGVKKFLQEKGVTEAGYHGLSIGGSLAFQAAAGNTGATEVQTRFVVADQTFNSGKDVAANLVGNVDSKLRSISSLAKGTARASLPSGNNILLAEGIMTRTDGLDNATKAKVLRENNIPLFVIESDQDKLMGLEVNLDGIYSANIADDLLDARYDEDKRDSYKAVLPGGHCTFFADAEKVPKTTIDKIENFIKTAMPLHEEI